MEWKQRYRQIVFGDIRGSQHMIVPCFGIAFFEEVFALEKVTLSRFVLLNLQADRL